MHILWYFSFQPSHRNDDIDDIFDEISSLEDDEPVRRYDSPILCDIIL